MSGDGGDGPSAGSKEHRSGPRAPIELRVEYQRLNSFFADYTKNICKGGTFIKTKKPLDVGTEFLFKLVVPSLSEPICLRGDVRWTLREGEPPPAGIADDHEPGMGIRFIYQNTSERQIVERTVEKLMVDSVGQLLYSKLMEHSREQGGGERGSDGGGPHLDPTYVPVGTGRDGEGSGRDGEGSGRDGDGSGPDGSGTGRDGEGNGG